MVTFGVPTASTFLTIVTRRFICDVVGNVVSVFSDVFSSCAAGPVLFIPSPVDSSLSFLCFSPS